MTHQARSNDFRLVGAAVALGLDVALLAFAAILLLASLSPAWGLVLAGTVGLVVAPFLGWRYGPRAVSRASDNWWAEAVATLLVVDASLVAGIVFQAIVGHTNDESGGVLAFIAYVILYGAIVTIVLTCLVALPMGVAWRRVMLWVAARRSAI